MCRSTHGLFLGPIEHFNGIMVLGHINLLRAGIDMVPLQERQRQKENMNYDYLNALNVHH